MDVRETVLLVEDDAPLSALVTGLIEEAGYQAVTITDHALVGAAVERWRPRCVIIDGGTQMERTGPWNDAIALRRDHPTLPLLMFTADPEAVAEERARTSERSLAAGFAGSVAKPFLVEEFLSTLAAVMHVPPWPAPAVMPARDGGAAPIGAFPGLVDVGGIADRMDFVTSVVHELRQPLAMIRGQIQLLARDAGGDLARQRSALALALAQVDRMTRMTDELLDLSRLGANSMSLEVAAFDMVGAATQAVARHAHEGPRRVDLAAGARAAVAHGDARRIGQILDNLIGNALKYSDPGSLVEVTVTTSDGAAVVSVRDQGVGVPDDEQTLLFTPFFRTTRTRDRAGTGLGLHISRQLAERQGGRVWLVSTSAAGSVFALAMPLAH